MFVDPGARLAVQSGDLSGIDERLGRGGREAVQPHGQTLSEQVREPVERFVVAVDGLRLAAPPRLDVNWDRRLRCQTRSYVLWQRCSTNGVFDRTTNISVI
jgi:hypothetical protein